MRADSKPNSCMVICIYICIGGSMSCLPAFKRKRMSLFLQHTLLLNEPSLVRKTLVLWYITSVKIGRKIFQGLLLTADLAKTNIWRAFFSTNKAHLCTSFSICHFILIDLYLKQICTLQYTIHDFPGMTKFHSISGGLRDHLFLLFPLACVSKPFSPMFLFLGRIL